MDNGNGMGGIGLGELSSMMLRLNGQLNDLAARNQALEEELGQLKVTNNVTEDWLQIPYRFVDLAAGATATVTQTIAGDGPFDLIEITGRAIDDAGTVSTAYRIRIREGEAVGRSLTLNNEFVDADNSVGTAQRPYIIKGRRRFRANIAVVVEVTNTSAGDLTIEVVLHGIKVFTR